MREEVQGRHQAAAAPGSLVELRIRASAQALRSIRRYRMHLALILIN